MSEHQRFVDMDIVRNNPNEYWNLFWLSLNKQITVKDIEDLKLSNIAYRWDWNFISQNIDINEVRNNPNKPWDINGLSCNKQLTVKDIENLKLPNSTGTWKWDRISADIASQEVINNPNKPWDREGLKANDSITDKILEFFDAGLLKHLQKNIPKFKYHTDIVIKCE